MTSESSLTHVELDKSVKSCQRTWNNCGFFKRYAQRCQLLKLCQSTVYYILSLRGRSRFSRFQTCYKVFSRSSHFKDPLSYTKVPFKVRMDAKIALYLSSLYMFWIKWRRDLSSICGRFGNLILSTRKPHTKEPLWMSQQQAKYSISWAWTYIKETIILHNMCVAITEKI